MKKIVFVAIFALTVLGGCGSASKSGASESSTIASSTTSESTALATTESTQEVNLAYFYKDKKETTELDDLLVTVSSKLGHDHFKDLDIQSDNFEPAKAVFIYVDGEQAGIDSELASGLRKSTPITDEKVEKGVHSVELAQYENDDDTTEPVLYVRSTYEVE